MKHLLYSYGYCIATVVLGLVSDRTGNYWFFAGAVGTAVLSSINYIRFARTLI